MCVSVHLMRRWSIACFRFSKKFGCLGDEKLQFSTQCFHPAWTGAMRDHQVLFLSFLNYVSPWGLLLNFRKRWLRFGSIKPKSSSGQFGEIVSSGDSLFWFFFFPDCATGSREATRWGRGGSLVYNIDRFFSKLLGSEWTLEITELRWKFLSP